MTIKILVDTNYSPEWVPALVREGWEAVHWSTASRRSVRERAGAPRESPSEDVNPSRHAPQ